MFDNIFSTSPGVWTGLIAGAVAIPILIHLINLVRHKTVRWAAMDFLLKSHKRNKNYIWLKQLLLLLARIAMLLLALMLLGQVGCHSDRISRLLGGRSTHHYVLLDDSFSMSQRGDDESDPTAFDRAKSTLSLIAQRAKDRQNQKFSLFRYSKVQTENSDSDEDSASAGDLENILVDSQFDSLLETVKGSLEVSWYNINMGTSLARVKTLIEERSDENAILYVLSDYREKDFETPAYIAKTLSEVRSLGGAVELINCATDSPANVGVVDLQPAGNVRVAGAPLMMELKVKNFGTDVASKIQAKISTTAFGQPNIPANLRSQVQELPTVFIAEILPGETQTRRFPVFFDAPGTHVVSAQMNEDNFAADDRRDCTVEFFSAAKVLIVDDARQLHSDFLSLALRPNADTSTTGIDPVFRTKAFLRDASAEELDEFEVIFLLDVDTLDDVAVRNVETFCENGGGVAFFGGPKSDIGFYNSLHQQGQGIYPIELDQSAEVVEDPAKKSPDFQAETHPIFAPVNGQKTTLLDLVEIERSLVPTRAWLLDSGATETIATVRGDKKRPLFVTGQFGNGRVMAVTTTAGPVWNNWARNATFPPILLLMHDYLSAGRQNGNDELVQTPVSIDLEPAKFLPNAQILKPVSNSQPRELSELKLVGSKEGLLVNKIAGVPGTESSADPFEVRRPGVYDVWLQQKNGEYMTFRRAFNLDQAESNLQQIGDVQLVATLDGSQPVLSSWKSFNPEPEQRQASSLLRLFLLLLTVLIVAEQLLAYASSYHQS